MENGLQEKNIHLKVSLDSHICLFEGIAGLAITYGLNLNVVQFRIIWNLCNLENKIISLERILQYNCIPDEAPLVIESNKPTCLWPSQGEVDIRNLQVILIFT